MKTITNWRGTIMKEISKEAYDRLPYYPDYAGTNNDYGFGVSDPTKKIAELEKKETALRRKGREDEREMIKHRRETRKIKDPKERKEWRNGWASYNYYVYKTRKEWEETRYEISLLKKIQDAYRGKPREQ